MFGVRKESTDSLTRRDFGKAVLGGLSVFALRSTITGAQAAKPNRSFINGVQFGLQPLYAPRFIVAPRSHPSCGIWRVPSPQRGPSWHIDVQPP